MAKKGSTKRVTGEWAKHLRKDGKRTANKVERQSGKIKYLCPTCKHDVSDDESHICPNCGNIYWDDENGIHPIKD